MRATAEAWGKTAVVCRSTPGFIVNRIARPFYGEALRALAEGAADAPTIDAIMRDAGGFRMGPLELIDLIGLDVNLAVSQSIHGAHFGDPRYTPSLIQREMVDAGRLGRKSGHGFYDHSPEAEPSAPQVAAAAPAPQRITVEGDLGLAGPLLERWRGRRDRDQPALGRGRDPDRRRQARAHRRPRRDLVERAASGAGDPVRPGF